MNTVFPQYRDKGLDDFKADNPYLERAVEVTRDYIASLKQMRHQGKGICFLGQNGVGKTHLACSAMSAAEDAGYKIECIELSTYVEMRMEQFGVHSDYEDDQEQAYELRRRLRYIQRQSRFLLLDDLGREHESRSGWSNHMVFDLLRYRFNRCLPTLVTTNLPMSELDSRYTQGLASHLHEATILVRMDGEDYRAAWTTGD